MHLFLVRHGESVDNVAGLCAGSRDSPLTSHGVLQGRRLGAHLVDRAAAIGPVAHIFSSDLQRASKTAEAILDAQKHAQAEGAFGPPLVRLVELRERDFRSSEGRRFGSGSDTANPHPDAESHDEMKIRVDRFIETHLRPLLSEGESAAVARRSIVIVAHGIILNVLLKSLLSTFAPDELSSLYPSGDPARRSQHMAWSNTGYLEATVLQSSSSSRALPGLAEEAAQIGLAVAAVNCLDHLQGLKKTRGGIGSAKFDENQRTLDPFFGPASKKQKHGNSSADGQA